MRLMMLTECLRYGDVPASEAEAKIAKQLCVWAA